MHVQLLGLTLILLLAGMALLDRPCNLRLEPKHKDSLFAEVVGGGDPRMPQELVGHVNHFPPKVVRDVGTDGRFLRLAALEHPQLSLWIEEQLG